MLLLFKLLQNKTVVKTIGIKFGAYRLPTEKTKYGGSSSQATWAIKNEQYVLVCK